jgi:pimeloyl-ACP methyl ester carboxylesterase
MLRAGPHLVAVDFYGDDGPQILLLHGIPGDRTIWSAVARRLRGNQIVAPDLLGFGGSSEPIGNPHAAGQAEMLAALIGELGRQPVHVVGFDFGGPVAVLLAARYPHYAASLTLAATNVLVDTPIPGPLHLVRPPILGDLFARMIFSRPGLSGMWFGAVARRDRFPFSNYRGLLSSAKGVRWTREIFQMSLRDLPGLYGPVQDALPRLRLPCQVLWGERDPFFARVTGERTAAMIPGASFRVLPGTGHFLPAEDPEGFACAVAALTGAVALGGEQRQPRSSRLAEDRP